MLECFTLTLCVVGGMQISPDYYQLEVLDTIMERVYTYYMPMPESRKILAEISEV
tara:strand:- start:372 stop:536 length:165 start_codon:yes stop_codon:yes gene_type:complete